MELVGTSLALAVCHIHQRSVADSADSFPFSLPPISDPRASIVRLLVIAALVVGAFTYPHCRCICRRNRFCRNRNLLESGRDSLQ